MNGASLGVDSLPSSTPRLLLPADQLREGEGWTGWGFFPHKPFAAFLTVPPHPCNILAALGPRLLLPFICLVPPATGETQNPAEHPGMQSICNKSQLRGASEGCSRLTGKGWGCQHTQLQNPDRLNPQRSVAMGPTQDNEAAVWGTTALNFPPVLYGAGSPLACHILWLLNIYTGNTNFWITEDCKLAFGK